MVQPKTWLRPWWPKADRRRQIMLKSVTIGRIIAMLAILAAMDGTAIAAAGDQNGVSSHAHAKSTTSVPHR
jgi:hypothetical protein